jgi:hypothetical protein
VCCRRRFADPAVLERIEVGERIRTNGVPIIGDWGGSAPRPLMTGSTAEPAGRGTECPRLVVTTLSPATPLVAAQRGPRGRSHRRSALAAMNVQVWPPCQEM